MPADQTSVPSAAQLFATTHWSLVLQAGGQNSPQSAEALAQLCRAYWYPLYAYVRRQGHDVHDAQDLTQEFFARLLGQDSIRRANPQRGRFRTFLLSSLKNFLINEWNKAKRQKRGGGHQFLSLDAQETETRFQAEPADHQSPDKAYERRWAMVLLDRVLSQLQCELVACGQGRLFDELKFCLTGQEAGGCYAEIGGRLGMTEGNVKVNVHRLRRRYRELLREEIGRTVEDPTAIDDEIRELFAALGN